MEGEDFIKIKQNRVTTHNALLFNNLGGNRREKEIMNLKDPKRKKKVIL